MLGNVAANFVAQGVLNEILQTLSILQLILHNNLLQVMLPFNAEFFLGFLLSIVSFDLVDTNRFWVESFKLEKVGAWKENFNKLGYQSLYFSVNMGSILLFILTWPFIVIIAALIA